MTRKPTLKEWVFATRPWSFATSAFPAVVVVAYMFCFKESIAAPIQWWHGALSVLGTIIVHSGGNLMSDYFDFKYDVDREDRMGNSLLMMNGTFTPVHFLIYGLSCLFIGSAIGIYLFINTGWPLLAIGMLGILGAIFYYKFKYIALGDFVIFVIYGPLIMLGTAYAMTSQLSWQIGLLSLPIALMSVNILHANNTRDIENDGRAGIRTLAMNVGGSGSVALYKGYIYCAYGLLIVYTAIGILPPLSLIALATYPIARANMKMATLLRTEGKEAIRQLDAHSAKFQMMLCLSLSLSLIISFWL